MKYEYKGATGKTEIEVNEHFYEILVALDREEYNSDQRETRRHASLEAFNLDDTLFPSDVDIHAEIEQKERDDALQTAIEKLKPEQQTLIRAVYFDGVPVTEYAEREGVDHSAISHRLRTIYKKLKNLL